MENVRVKMSFFDKDWNRISKEVWQWTDGPTHLLLHEWIFQRFTELCGAPQTIKKIVINQFAVHPRQLWELPLDILQDEDVVKVSMEELTLQHG